MSINLISCKGCGVVLDLELVKKIFFRDDYFDYEQVCPVCNIQIIEMIGGLGDY